MKEDYICYIGRPSYQKNTLFLIDVVNEVHSLCPQLNFKLLGVGYYSPDLDKVKNLIRERKLENVIELLPWLEHGETLRYVKDSLFYLSVAKYEGLPLAVIEAMSLGKAIVASDVVGNKDCVTDGENGFLLPLEVESFVKAIISLVGDENLRTHFEQNSRRIFERKFQIEHRIQELVNIYYGLS